MSGGLRRVKELGSLCSPIFFSIFPRCKAWSEAREPDRRTGNSQKENCHFVTVSKVNTEPGSYIKIIDFLAGFSDTHTFDLYCGLVGFHNLNSPSLFYTIIINGIDNVNFKP